jgi:hypothetical protein
MWMLGSIFLEFNLPNATTWFYVSLVLAVALFFKFARFLSMRNLDVLTLFLLVPGLLLRQEAHSGQAGPEVEQNGVTPAAGPAEAAAPVSDRLVWFAYLWLLCGSGYFLARCLLDLTLVRRPALGPNLNIAGLAWLGGALLVCLVVVAVRQSPERLEKVGRPSIAQEKVPEAIGRGLGSDPGNGDVKAWVLRGLAIACHLAIVAALMVIGWRHFQDLPAGMAAATFYLLLPYTAHYAGQWHHVWPTALLLSAVACYRWPMVAGLLLGLAAGSSYFPALVFPIWFSFYWKRGIGRFSAAFLLAASLSLAAIGFFAWLDGTLTQRLESVWALSDWQAWKQPSEESFWKSIAGAWAYRMPVFIAYLAFVLTTAFWPLPKNLAHVLALSAAVLIGIQFWYADQGGVYVLWYLPLLLLLAFRPNLVDRQPPPISADTDWLIRARRAMVRFAGRVFRPRLPLERSVSR